jgi:integrase
LKGMPRLCAAWKAEPVRDRGLKKYAPKVRKEYERMLDHIAKWFVNFDVHQVQTHHIAKALDTKFPDKPRTHNAYRSLMALLFRYAIVKGLRTDNPVLRTTLGTMAEGKRKRYIRPDELAIIRANGDAKLGLVIDLAIITGQRIGDLIALEWRYVTDKGIIFHTSKEGVTVPVKMNDDLRLTLDALKGGITPLPTAPVIRTQAGGRYTYSGIYSAWRRACLPEDETKPRVLDAHIHDLRHNALTDAKAQGLDPQALAGHKSAQMTEHYLEQIELKWVEPVRLTA